MSAVKAIYAGAAAVGLTDDEDRRDFYHRVTGKRRLREMNGTEKEAVVAELRKLGFKPGPRTRSLTGPYARKLQALWISGWNLGLVDSARDAALLAFVKRQTGFEATRFLRDPMDAAKVIEGLKAWLARDGGVVWDPKPCPAWLKEPAAKVALAQYFRLTPDPGGNLRAEFWQALAGAVPTDRMGLETLTAADWRAVVNHFGAQIRAGKGP